MRSFLAFPLLVSIACSQGWVDRTPSNPLQTPSPRAFPAMCWDGAHGYVLLFGGQPNMYASGGPNETWTWNGTTWTRRLTATPGFTFSLEQQAILAMAFHAPSNQAVLLWGGGTFVWNGTDWFQHPSSLPMPGPFTGAPTNVAMGYDPGTGQLVAFVGTLWANPNLYFVSFTFTWDGNSWTRRLTGFNPWPVLTPTMAFDPVANRLVLGTQGANGAGFFEWTGSNWQQRLPANAPSAPGVFATDTGNNRLVMFDADLGTQPGHTWTLANGALQQLATPLEPGRRFGSAMAYDPVRQRLVLFGGTMNWSPSQPLLSNYLGDTRERTLLFA
jgi:hypothetical protein